MRNTQNNNVNCHKVLGHFDAETVITHQYDSMCQLATMSLDIEGDTNLTLKVM